VDKKPYAQYPQKDPVNHRSVKKEELARLPVTLFDLKSTKSLAGSESN
jgi:hypothetical protein